MTRRDGGTLVCGGGAIKALDETGRVGGYLVLFGDPDNTDASAKRDFFTPETDFRLATSTKSAVLYNHGLDDTMGLRELAIGEVKVQDAGVWIEAQMKLRDDYEKKLFEATKAGKMGWSSGTASHLVRRERQKNGAHKVLSWPLGLDASLTPTPAEPRTQALAIKSLDEWAIETKARPLGDYAAGEAMSGALERLDAIFRARAYEALSQHERDTLERRDIVDTLIEHHDAMRRKVLHALIDSPGSGDAEMKAVLDDAFGDLYRNTRLGNHLALVRAAVARLTERVRDYRELKTRDGRAIPAERAEQIKALRDGLDELLRADADPTGDVSRLLDSFLAVDSRLAGIL